MNPLPPRAPTAGPDKTYQPILSRAEEIAQQYQRVVQKDSGVPKLMSPPKPHTPYHHQTLIFTLYRRVEGSFPQKGQTEKRLSFPDGSGYILVEGVNCSPEDCHLNLQNSEEGWNINMKGENLKKPPGYLEPGGSPLKRTRNLQPS